MERKNKTVGSSAHQTVTYSYDIIFWASHNWLKAFEIELPVEISQSCQTDAIILRVSAYFNMLATGP